MTDKQQNPISEVPSRRDFLRTSSAVVAGGVLAGSLNIARSAHAAGDDLIRIGLVGCGDRGTGAAIDSLKGRSNLKLVAMGDVFRDKLDQKYQALMKSEVKDLIDISEDRKFDGFDAYQKVIDSGVDMVILATPPGFRPLHFEAAVKAGKHVFMEKPVATDAPGVRMVLAAAEEAKKKNLGVGVGLQRRHQNHYMEIVKRIQDGEIGDVHHLRVFWNGKTPWVHEREKLKKEWKPEFTEMEYQLRNWYYFVWLCGDHIVEQHIHNLDVANWVLGGYPIRANGMGGCEVRKGPDFGETFDHHFVEFEYANGVHVYSQCRHIPNCWSPVEEHVLGTKGSSFTNQQKGSMKIAGQKDDWRYTGSNPNPYQVEHVDLITSIRAGSPINEAERGAKSTMTAIMGRMATYCGQPLKWEDALNSPINYQPKEYAITAAPPVLPGADGLYKRPIPGLTKVI